MPEKLKPLYAYLNDPRQSQVSPLTRMIDARVKKFNTDEWRRKYMTFEYMLKERERIGIEQGRAEGEAIGLKKGAAQKQREIAKNLKDLGVGAAEIISGGQSMNPPVEAFIKVIEKGSAERTLFYRTIKILFWRQSRQRACQKIPRYM